MYYKELLRQEWLRTIRGTLSAQSVGMKIFWGIYFLFVGVSLAAFSFFAPMIFADTFPSLDSTQVLSGLIPFLMLAGLAIRLLLQPLSHIEENIYRHLPIPRKVMTQYILFRPLINPVNYYAQTFLFFPFAIAVMIKSGVADGMTVFLIGLLLTMTNTLLAPYLKRIIGGEGILLYIIVFGTVAALILAEITGILPWAEGVFNFVSSLHSIYIGIAMFLIGLGTYFGNEIFFKHHFYPKERKYRHNKSGSHNSLNFVRQYGNVGEIIALHLKIMKRSKRIRNALIPSVIFLCYGLLFYEKPNISFYAMAIIAHFIVNLISIMMGQWVIRWDCDFFDGLMSQAITSRLYIRSHYLILIGLNIISFILTTPYIFMGVEIFYLHLSLFLCNCGIGIIIILLLSTFNTGHIDLEKSGAFSNMQGNSLKNLMATLPMTILIPTILWLLYLLTDIHTAEIVLGLIGILGILAQKPLLELCTRVFEKRKYALAESFREGYEN